MGAQCSLGGAKLLAPCLSVQGSKRGTVRTVQTVENWPFRCPSEPWQWGSMHNGRTLKLKQLNEIQPSSIELFTLTCQVCVKCFPWNSQWLNIIAPWENTNITDMLTPCQIAFKSHWEKTKLLSFLKTRKYWYYPVIKPGRYCVLEVYAVIWEFKNKIFRMKKAEGEDLLNLVIKDWVRHAHWFIGQVLVKTHWNLQKFAPHHYFTCNTLGQEICPINSRKAALTLIFEGAV